MAKLKKIAEIKAYYGCEAKEVVETLENKGFLVVDDDENDTVNKIWHVLKNVENQWNIDFFWFSREYINEVKRTENLRWWKGKGEGWN